MTTNANDAPRLPGASALGFGYDATGDYANVTSLTEGQIFDLGPFEPIDGPINGKMYTKLETRVLGTVAVHKKGGSNGDRREHRS